MQALSPKYRGSDFQPRLLRAFGGVISRILLASCRIGGESGRHYGIPSRINVGMKRQRDR
jgi:hypothetical protein